MKFVIANHPRIHVRVFDRSASLEIASEFSCDCESELILAWLKEYAAKRNPAPLPLLTEGTPFQEAVWEALRSIPFAQVFSYGELAAKIGHGMAARAVGNACGRNPYPLFTPCHRIIAANGTVGGFSGDLEVKRRLLAFEGA